MKEQIQEYLLRNKNDDPLLFKKLFVLFCYFGAFRVSESYNLCFGNITKIKEGVEVIIKRTKTVEKHQVILVPSHQNPLLYYLMILNKYIFLIGNKGPERKFFSII